MVEACSRRSCGGPVPPSGPGLPVQALRPHWGTHVRRHLIVVGHRVRTTTLTEIMVLVIVVLCPLDYFPPRRPLTDRQTQPCDTDADLLFPEARQRRRRRILLVGFDRLHGSDGRRRVVRRRRRRTLLRSPTVRTQWRRTSGARYNSPIPPTGTPWVGSATGGTGVCDHGIVPLVPNNTKASASFFRATR